MTKMMSPENQELMLSVLIARAIVVPPQGLTKGTKQ